MKKQVHYGVALAFLLTACGSETATAPGQPTEATAETPPVALGQTASSDGVQIVITDVDQTKQLGPAGVGLTAEPSETFVVVSYTIKNTSDEALSFMQRPGLSLIDQTGRTYAPDDMAAAMSAVSMDDPSGMASDLNPNVSAKTKAAWKLDEASFDPATWRLVVSSSPAITLALQ